MSKTRRNFFKALLAGSAATLAGCDFADPLPEHQSENQGRDDCPPLEDIVVSYLAPCVPGGQDAMEVDLESNMNGITEVEYREVTGDTCGLYTAGLGHWIQRRIELEITGLVGDAEAVEKYAPMKDGHQITFDIFPKTDTGQGSTLVDVNGASVDNTASRYELFIRQTGLEDDDKEYYEDRRGPLTWGDINAVIRYAGDEVNSVQSTQGFLAVPEDANVVQKNLTEAYA